jgi:hypothetical protein
VIEVQDLYMRLDTQATKSVIQVYGIPVVLRKQNNENGNHPTRYHAALFFHHRSSDESSWLTRAASTCPAFGPKAEIVSAYKTRLLFARSLDIALTPSFHGSINLPNLFYKSSSEPLEHPSKWQIFRNWSTGPWYTPILHHWILRSPSHPCKSLVRVKY